MSSRAKTRGCPPVTGLATSPALATWRRLITPVTMPTVRSRRVSSSASSADENASIVEYTGQYKLTYGEPPNTKAGVTTHFADVRALSSHGPRMADTPWSTRSDAAGSGTVAKDTGKYSPRSPAGSYVISVGSSAAACWMTSGVSEPTCTVYASSKATRCSAVTRGCHANRSAAPGCLERNSASRLVVDTPRATWSTCDVCTPHADSDLATRSVLRSNDAKARTRLRASMSAAASNSCARCPLPSANACRVTAAPTTAPTSSTSRDGQCHLTKCTTRRLQLPVGLAGPSSPATRTTGDRIEPSASTSDSSVVPPLLTAPLRNRGGDRP
mmetsp:Transcript_3517/g.12791  ORF Transcript_3517/g.12791 Transcript_3517/m.12791 type:complete len:328 (+) Transcript_3517:445-1428(+)